MEQILRLRLQLVENTGFTSYRCQVVRVIERGDNTYEYGLLFARLNKKKINDLMQDIMDNMEKAEEKMLS